MILANNITLSYDGEKNIIENASFRQIKVQDFVFITGSSGSGKSTLLKSFYSAIKLKTGRNIASTPKTRSLSSKIQENKRF